MYSLNNMYLSLQNGQKIIAIELANNGIIKGRLIVGNVNAKAFGAEYQDGYDVKMIAEQAKVAPKMRRMLDDASSTVFRTVSVHYDLTSDIIYTDSLDVKPLSVDKDGLPATNLKINVDRGLGKLSSTSLAVVKALAERRVTGDDILRDLKLNDKLDWGLRLVLSGMGRWILMQKGKTFNLVSLIKEIERQGQ